MNRWRKSRKIFSKETQCANDKRDENDENEDVMELNEDQNEMTQNLNSDLIDSFMEGIMVKIMDCIIADENKYEAEKS